MPAAAFLRGAWTTICRITWALLGVVTNATGTTPTLDDSDFYPFGGERDVLFSSGNTYRFTGKERDSESGLDDFGKGIIHRSTVGS